MTRADHDDLVRQVSAELAVRPKTDLIESVVKRSPGVGLLDAYRLQEALGAIESAARPLGYKIALGSLEAQASLSLRSPATGRLLANRCLPNQTRVRLDAFRAPILEVELAVELSDKPPGAGTPSSTDVTTYARRLLPAVEIVERRIALAPDASKGLDFIIDNAAFGACVIGDEPVKSSVPNLGDVQVVLSREGVEIANGGIDAGFYGPMATTGRTLAALRERGQEVACGDYVLSGAILPAVVLELGTYAAIFSVGGSASATVEFTVE